MHLDDTEIVELHEAARRADDYAVTHKLFVSQTKQTHRDKGAHGMRDAERKNGNSGSRSDQTKKGELGPKSPESEGSRTYCDFHKKPQGILLMSAEPYNN